ncbi:chemotaxis protein CheW [Thermomonas sp.]|uniref:chemotaxis protein CheW n=1 Tax=Thermomonas sp. TaxID=1971895 RepID=UPI0035B3C645
MSPQGTTLASKPGAEMVVDAYVDALLAMPVVGAVPAPVEPGQPPLVVARDEVADGSAPLDATAPEALAGVPDAPVVDDTSAGEVAMPLPAATDGAPDPDVDAWERVAEHDASDAAVAAEPDVLSAGDAAEGFAMPAPEPVPPEPVAEPAMPAAGRPAKPAIAVQDEADEVAPAEAPIGQRWLRVAVGDDRYAVELLRVQEVVRLAPLIAVRGAVPSLLGVMNLRGRVVPVHDLGRWLRRAPVQVDERSRIVVLEFQDDLVGLLVTAVTDVVTLDGPQIEPPTRGLRDRIGMGIARTPGAPPTVLLDARVVFD